MNKILIPILCLCATVCFGQSKRIDQYPANATPAAGDMFLGEKADLSAYFKTTWAQILATSNNWVGMFTGNGATLTNIPPSAVVSNGTYFANGTMSTNSGLNNGFLTETGDKRKLTLDLSAGTNVNPASLSGTNIIIGATKTTIQEGSANTLVVTNGMIGVGTTSPSAIIEAFCGAVPNSSAYNGLVFKSQAATAGTTRVHSPALFMQGSMYDTSAHTKAFQIDLDPGGSALPSTSYLVFNLVVDGATSQLLQIVGDGSIAAKNFLTVNGQSIFDSKATGEMLLRPNGGSVFRVDLGGSTASYPAIKQNGPAINFRLADDSADAAITSASHAINGSIKFVSVTASNPPTSGAGTAFIFSATNNTGTAEIFTMDGAGVIKQISEHALDAPDALIDDADEAPNISKEILLFTGKVRWINRSRAARIQEMMLKLSLNSLAYYQFTTGKTPTQWTNANAFGSYTNAVAYLDPLTAGQKQMVMVESFAEYNTRTGLTNGNGLVKLNWSDVQAQIQSDYAATYTNAVTAALLSTNAVAPVWSPPPSNAVPAWLSRRGVL